MTESLLITCARMRVVCVVSVSNPATLCVFPLSYHLQVLEKLFDKKIINKISKINQKVKEPQLLFILAKEEDIRSRGRVSNLNSCKTLTSTHYYCQDLQKYANRKDEWNISEILDPKGR